MTVMDRRAARAALTNMARLPTRSQRLRSSERSEGRDQGGRGRPYARTVVQNATTLLRLGTIEMAPTWAQGLPAVLQRLFSSRESARRQRPRGRRTRAETRLVSTPPRLQRRVDQHMRSASAPTWAQRFSQCSNTGLVNRVRSAHAGAEPFAQFETRLVRTLSWTMRAHVGANG